MRQCHLNNIHFYYYYYYYLIFCEFLAQIAEYYTYTVRPY